MTVHFGDCREVMRGMIDRGERVQMCVTSPPYFGLRDYGHPGQIGLEPSPAEFVAVMVDVFNLVRQLLADDGTLWLNLGDSYSAGGRGSYDAVSDNNGTAGIPRPPRKRGSQLPAGLHEKARQEGAVGRAWVKPPSGFKPKDLLGIPWRVAFGLQEAGWYLRQDIIWAKPNPMPESVTDRCTKSHEYLFLLSKSPKYYFDQEAIAEPISAASVERLSQNVADQTGSDRVPGKTNGNMKAVYRGSNGHTEIDSSAVHDREPLLLRGEPASVPAGVSRSGNKERKPASARGVPVDTNGKSAGAVAGSVPWEGATRNKRSVWTVPTVPFSGAHFATFPPALIEPCILAGSRPGDIVLDPFFGSGTTGQVCNRLGRKHIGIEINQDYEPLQRDRTAQQGLEL